VYSITCLGHITDAHKTSRIKPPSVTTPGLGFRPNALAGPGPSSLRRLVTSRSDVFTHHPTRSEPFPPPKQLSLSSTGQKQNSYRMPIPRTQSGTATSTSAKRTSGSSWNTRAPTQSTSISSKPSSPMSIGPKSPQSHRRIPSITGTSPGTSFPPRFTGPGGITLPLNNSVSQLATLSHSAHTLSPYARGHEHIAVRSFPHLGKSGTGSSSTTSISTNLEAVNSGQIKARRKRIFHLGKKGQTAPGRNLDDEPISPDLDDIHEISNSPEWDSSSPSKVSEEMTRSWKPPASLTGVAERAMRDSRGLLKKDGFVTARPSYGRAPDSRTSYGFPPVQRRSLAGFGSIAE
jgi:distribution and morphology protein 34